MEFLPFSLTYFFLIRVTVAEHRLAEREEDGRLLFVRCPTFHTLGPIQALWEKIY